MDDGLVDHTRKRIEAALAAHALWLNADNTATCGGGKCSWAWGSEFSQREQIFQHDMHLTGVVIKAFASMLEEAV